MLCYDFPDPAPLNKQVKSNDLGHTEDNYIKLINKLKNLLPIECGDKLKALEEVISYVSSILYGDDLHRFATYNYYKKYVITALDELVLYVQEHSLMQYSQELALLKDEINDYLSKKEQYVKDISELEKQREKLQSQVDNLKEENQLLIDENTKIKASVDEYSTKMRKIGNDNQVIWEKVKDNDPIYAITPNTIHDYINELERAYMFKLGVSEQECKSDFMLNSSGLYALKKLLSSFKDHNNYDKSISYCIRKWDYLGIDSSCGITLGNIMSNIKLPKIVERTSTLPIVNLTNDVGDLNSVLRELHYQRVAFEALAKQRIAEAQLYSLFMALKQIAPEGYDFTQFAEIMDAYPIKPLLEDDGQSFTKKR